jgi:ABC-type uncharacterized transport system substrate-binding protein
MKNKISYVAVCALLFPLCSSVEAQQAKKVPLIGFLSGTSASATAHTLEAFREGLRELGYSEGKNIAIESRWAEGKPDRLPGLAARLVSLGVDLLVVASTQAVSAAKQATATIPIVVVVSADLVEIGLIKSLASPGGNITGMTFYSPQVTGKRLELLKEAFPKVSRVAVLGDSTTHGQRLDWQELKAASESLAVQLQSADAFLTLSPPLFTLRRKEIVTLAVKSRLPAIFHGREFVDGGGLMSYAPSLTDSFRRAAVYVDKILKGAKPGDLPVEQPTKFELVVNLKTAKQIGLTIPQKVLGRANKVIK